MQATVLRLGPGADLKRSLEELARQGPAHGFVLSIVGDLSQATFVCPGRSGPTVLRGALEIISLQGSLSPGGVHLHLSFSDSECQVWGGHLEQGTLLLKGAELLIGFPDEASSIPAPATTTTSHQSEPKVAIAVGEGCPWSRRAERLLHSLGIAYIKVPAQAAPLPQITIAGVFIGGYTELAEWHGQGKLEALRSR
jgi:predicted DNA-binding protein with PD1-like motif/glutaredoxin